MTNKEIRIQVLKSKINKTTNRGYGMMGVVRKWEREIRHLSR